MGQIRSLKQAVGEDVYVRTADIDTAGLGAAAIAAAAGGDLAGTLPNPTVAKSSTAFALTGDISPAAIAAQADNYNPTSLSTSAVLRLTLTGAQSVTGVAGGADGRLLVVHNVDTVDALTLVDESAASTAANRFALQGNVVLAPDTSVLLQYDSTSSRWRSVGAVLPAGALTADAAGLAIMADSYFSSEANFDTKADAGVIGEDRLTANQVTGRVMANVANVNVIGGIPVVHRITIADATADTDVVLTHKTRIVDVYAVKTAANGGAGDQVIIKNGANTISSTISLNAVDTSLVRATSMDDNQWDIAAAGTLRVSATKATNCACEVVVTGIRVA